MAILYLFIYALFFMQNLPLGGYLAHMVSCFTQEKKQLTHQ